MFTDLVQGGELFDYIVDMVSKQCARNGRAATSANTIHCYAGFHFRTGREQPAS